MAPAKIEADPILANVTAVQSRNFRLEQLEADLVVCGGGLAGVCTAITAARQGVSVVLLQDRPVLGGNSSSEVRLWILGATSHMFNNNRYAREGGLVDEILTENVHRNKEGNPVIFDTLLLEKVIDEPNIQLLLNTALIGCEKNGNKIEQVRAFCSQTSTEFSVKGSLFVDATGDGVLSFLSGAPFRIGAEQQSEFGELFAPDSEYGHLLGHSIYFYSKNVGRPVKFVPPSYALANIEKEIPRYRTFNTKEMGCQLWWIEYGGRLDTIHDTEKIKWELWKVVYGVWNFFKNSGKFPDTDNLTLEWVGTIPGKRESRRFVGPTMLKQQDIIEQRFHEDAVSYGGWSIDLHPADGVFSKVPGCTQWHSKGVYHIPFSTMVCSEVPNLMYGGRIISATHVAFGSSRVMATCGNNGNALGVAAALCQKLKIMPGELLGQKKIKVLQLELMRSGQYIPGFKLLDPLDHVRYATHVSASDTFQLSRLPSDGPPKTLTRSLAQMFPLSAGSIPTFTINVQANQSTSLTVQLRSSEKPYNYTPEVILSTQTHNLASGPNALFLSFPNIKNSTDQYLFICLLKNENVVVSTSRTRISGLLTVEHECTQEPPPGIGIDTFERWTPVRRPMGHNLAMEVAPPIKAWDVANLRNGHQRPTKRPNCWVVRGSNDVEDSGDGKERGLVKIGWEQEKKIGRIVVSFDTDFDNAMESVLRGHPEHDIPFCVRSWRILDLDRKVVVYEETDNHLARREVSFEPFTTKTLGLEISSIHGGGEVYGGVFEIRAYEA